MQRNFTFLFQSHIPRWALLALKQFIVLTFKRLQSQAIQRRCLFIIAFSFLPLSCCLILAIMGNIKNIMLFFPFAKWSLSLWYKGCVAGGSLVVHKQQGRLANSCILLLALGDCVTTVKVTFLKTGSWSAQVQGVPLGSEWEMNRHRVVGCEVGHSTVMWCFYICRYVKKKKGMENL